MSFTKPYVTKEEIEQARQLDLLSYLQRYRPDELVKVTRGVYSLRSHDSLKISNGKWYRWSKGVGGVSALDYLINVEGIPFVEAVRHLCDVQSTGHFRKQRRNRKNPAHIDAACTRAPAEACAAENRADKSTRRLSSIQNHMERTSRTLLLLFKKAPCCTKAAARQSIVFTARGLAAFGRAR